MEKTIQVYELSFLETTKLSRTSLELPPDLSFDGWCGVMRQLSLMEGAVHWWIGDALIYAGKRYGETYKEAEAMTGFSTQTLKNDKWVSQKVQKSYRKDFLSWTHHFIIAPLESDEQTYWLNLAQEKSWSVAELRKQIKRQLINDTRQKMIEAGAHIDLPDNVKVLTGDFRQLCNDIPNESIDFIFTDPPYDQESIPLYGDLAAIAKRVLRSQGSLICYVGHYALPEIFPLMTPHLRFWWTIALQHSGRSARLPGKWVFVEWKPLLWFVKDGRRDSRYVSDLFKSHQPDKLAHDWEQDTSEAVYYIKQLTDDNDIVLDPFCGSGTTLLAALMTERKSIGIEIDAEKSAIARSKINAYLTQ